MVSLVIDNVTISDDSECYIIAEIGHNHQGRLDIAMEMFRVARECGVNAVKLQKRDNRTLFTRAMYESTYNSENSYGPTYGAHREALEFGRDEYRRLQDYAAELGVTMFSTAFDCPSVEFLVDIGMPAIKLASGDLTNIPLLEHAASTGKPLIMSTGGGSLADVERAYHTIMPINKQLAILQCTASYPVQPHLMNLNVIRTYRERFPDAVVGLSDHQNGIAMAPVAYALGARVVEKHFTLNRAWKGTDHAFSLEPAGLRKLVRDLRRVREALGDGVKRAYEEEQAPLYKMAKKLVAARPLPAGHVLTERDIAVKSPADGLPPYELPTLIGRRTLRAFDADETLTFADLVDGER
jgi:sialic acid synthase